MKLLFDFIFRPRPSYPDSWKPAFVAMQLGFLAGALGLILRDLFIIYTIENWKVVVFTELAFGLIVGLGFFLHTMGKIFPHQHEQGGAHASKRARAQDETRARGRSMLPEARKSHCM